jgi:hypothetical protein
MPAGSLVRPLFPGPLDIIADVHGEIEALRSLLGHLGYRDDGTHPVGRRAVFVGDLTDRGPNSPAVVALAADWIGNGRAQCVLGNHELNILLDKERHGNSWYYGKQQALDRSGVIVSQVLADDRIRRQTRDLFASLPLVLEREDLRIVHACWSVASIAELADGVDAAELYRRAEADILADLDVRGVTDPVERNLAQQNGNPVKVLTSGPERRVEKPFEAGGKVRQEGRVPWWSDYADDAVCVFGHYWRIELGNAAGEDLFDRSRPFDWLGNGMITCIDYSVGLRWRERRDGKRDGTFQTFLAALRWPEKVLILDDGRRIPLPA